MKYIFNFKKYKKWRMDREKLDEQAIYIIEQFNHYEDLDGRELDELWREGRLILKDWCDIYE